MRVGRNPGEPRASDAGALFAEALDHHGAGRLDDAERRYRQALELEPGFAEARNNLGTLCLQLGRLEEAEASFRGVLASRPDFPEAFYNLGIALKRRGRLEEACESLRRALELRPGFAEAHHDLGNVNRLLGRLEEAEECHRSALAARPGYPEAQHALANLLAIAGRLEEAETGLRKALAARPDLPGARCNLGWVLAEAGRLEEAEQSYRIALEQQPDDRTAAFNLSEVLLLRGDFSNGWELFESRFEGGGAAHFEQSRELLRLLEKLPRWDGASLQGRGILVWSEQGLGDTVMMMRYLPLLRQRGAVRIAVICPEELVRLVRTIPEVDYAASGGTIPLGGLSCHCPFMSLPCLFRTRIDTIPGAVPYLNVPPALDRAWAGRLADVPRPRCGLAWAGSPKHGKDRARSIPLAHFAPLLKADNVTFFNLQKGPAAEELGSNGMRILDWMADCSDLLDTAALVAQLDLVISVDTVVAHLAGALGKPVWLLNRFGSEWRWLLEREDSPWYPTMRIFRQKARGDWAGVIEEAAAALGERLRIGCP
jgi:Flp pilus assembly protein TadD